MAKFNPSRLKLARTRRGLTMTALAKKAGLSLRMIVDYEKDYCLYEPSEQTIASFVDVLKYPADFSSVKILNQLILLQYLFVL